MNDQPEDLSIPGLDEAVADLVSRFGVAAVADAAKRIARRSAGRTPDPDLQRLGKVFRQDARDVLEKRERRSNYAIAKAFAQAHPGHSSEATRKRIERKLGKERRRITLAMAAHYSADGYPYGSYLEVLEQLAGMEDSGLRRRRQRFLMQPKGTWQPIGTGMASRLLK